MNKMSILFLICSVLFIFRVEAQSYLGPSLGSVSSGVTQTTNSFPKIDGLGQPKEFQIGNEETYFTDTPEYYNFSKPAPIEGSNYYADKNVLNKSLTSAPTPILFKSFNGVNMTNSIPPDENLAVGPTHIIATVNTSFNIWDKNGNLVKSINGSTWVTQIIANPGPTICDPKIAYDHFANRWIMVWLTVNATAHTSYWTVSVSKDSTPIGTWYSWATPCHFNGTDTTNNFGDYEGVGFDKDCIYISGNQWDMTTSQYKYSKIRIIPKAALYANTAGPITWWDIWGIPVASSSASARTLRPSYVWGTPDAYYLISANSGGSNYMSLYKITNPVTAPVMTITAVPVTTYTGAGNADQLGGSSNGTTTLLVETGGSQIQNEPKYRDGFLWVTHSVRNPTNATYSAIHYVKIDVNTNTTVEDAVLGSSGNWYYYPSIIVDQNKNMAIAFSRSGLNEYIGSYYTSKFNSDPPGLTTSYPLLAGKANYVVDYGGGRNRWGDYSGFCVDPADVNNLWMIGEYVSAKNVWATVVGGLRLVPFTGVKAFASTQSLNFGSIELPNTSITNQVVIKNYGSGNLIISGIPKKTGPFNLTDNITFPVNLASYDSLVLNFNFVPTQSGVFVDTVLISSNDPSFTGLILTGRGFKINTAKVSTFYASSGINNVGNILTINLLTGTGTNLGPSLFTEMRGIAVHPKTKFIFGISTNTDSTQFVRVNASGGDSYNLFTAQVGDMAAISFDSAGILYAAMRSGVIYSVNLSSENLTQVCSTKVKLQSISFNPLTNELFGTPYIAVGSKKDALFKINITTGDTTYIGKNGTNILTNGICFDNQGNLFGVSGNPAAVNNLFSINTATGASTTIGSVGLNNITSLSYSSPGPQSVGSETVLPITFSLSQNYPNPFNPSTTIEYSVPKSSNVKISIYNLLGEVVEVLDNSFRQAGSYKVTWNPGRIASGVYFYELKAVSSSGDEFSQMKKMIMLK